MICFEDKTYCASPNCKNECGRQLTDDIRQAAIKADMPIMQGYFCEDKPEPKSICACGDKYHPVGAMCL